MTISIYMDVHVRRAITAELRRAGVDVLTAQEDGCGELSDPQLLERATSLGRILFTMDDDLLTEATRRQMEGLPFAGVIYTHWLRITIGQAVRDIRLIAEVYEPADIARRRRGHSTYSASLAFLAVAEMTRGRAVWPWLSARVYLRAEYLRQGCGAAI